MKYLKTNHENRWEVIDKLWINFSLLPHLYSFKFIDLIEFY